MEVDSTILLSFSPTGTTASIVEGISRGIRFKKTTAADLTPSEAGRWKRREVREEMAIIGAPVYGGRIPREAIRRLRRIKGGNTPAVVVVVYGNREYEDALLELHDLAIELGFRPIAAGAFIGEHSYSSEAVPIAAGRPDVRDLAIAREFGEAIREKIEKIRTLDEMPPPVVPGNYPYKKRNPPSKMSPVTAAPLCTLCETCAAVCPTGAIAVEDEVITRTSACIHCSACVKKCPTGARAWAAAGIEKAAKWLGENCRERKEPERYL